eukprot:12654097-Heterocapsa_arctica.AAC.1
MLLPHRLREDNTATSERVQDLRRVQVLGCTHQGPPPDEATVSQDLQLAIAVPVIPIDRDPHLGFALLVRDPDLGQLRLVGVALVLRLERLPGLEA